MTIKHLHRRSMIGFGMELAALLACLTTMRLSADDAQPQKSPPATSQKSEQVVDPNQLEDGVVTGILVRASDGSPVADATVILHTGGSNKTKSGAEGRFRLEKIKSRTWAYPLFAHQGNLVTKVVEVSTLPNADPAVAKFAPVRLEMTEGKQASFLVTSEITGQPIAGAAIRFGYPDRRLITTDEQGHALMQGLMPKPLYGEGYEVIIEAEGHARSAPQLKLSPSKAVTDFEVALTTGGIVQGTVVDVDGKPVPEVNVYYRTGDDVGFHGDTFRTNAEGKFQHRFLPLDVPIEVSANKKDYLPQQQSVTLTSQEREQKIQLTMPARPRGGSVAGVVTDEEGTPIADALVTNDGRSSDDHHETKTDAAGKFVMHDVFPGANQHEVSVVAKGFAPRTVTVEPGTEQDPGTIYIELKPGHTLHGRVQLENGEPAKNAMIYLRSGAYSWRANNWITTDGEGAFQADSLPVDVSVDVQLRGYPMMHSAPIQLDTAEPFVITIESPGVIRGRVIDDETGRPVPQFRIRMTSSSVRKPGDRRGGYEGSWSNPGITFESEKGEFLFQPITVGMPLDLIIEQEGYLRSVFIRAVATKESDAEPVLISLERLHPENLFTLTGRLLDHTGQGAAKAQLRLIVSSTQPTGINDNNFNWVLINSNQLGEKSYCEQYLSKETDAEGRFKFENVLPGNYLQLAYWGSGVPKGRSLDFDVTKAGGSEDVTIQLPEPAAIRGSLIRENFPDAGSIRLSLDGEAWHDYEIKLTDEQDTFEFRDLPPGKYAIYVGSKPVRIEERGGGYRTTSLAHQRIQLNPGQTEEIEFTQPDPQRQKK